MTFDTLRNEIVALIRKLIVKYKFFFPCHLFFREKVVVTSKDENVCGNHLESVEGRLCICGTYVILGVFF